MHDRLLSMPALTTLKKAETLYVSAISCWEVALPVKKGRLGIENVTQWIQDALQFPRIRAFTCISPSPPGRL
jgi:PIN domain nuclease of toxin-antitoxin system